ncbi:hypothetical protein, conserved [Trypanosoma brucei brucei TREU927]|uniref:Uncharacterized protein n=1 Tax=Trypanosoma brucei brucei (strain 927/4 GUTat10.1) TaxID=185431 RepID=Q387T1_TRYB2|nr:hypothetical protein, conserved [Trypanosoma brucei brucei TREU927]EAN78941.1 hypothetical protein, conserved [Trypanosoma brucei brucei TREU927]
MRRCAACLTSLTVSSPTGAAVGASAAPLKTQAPSNRSLLGYPLRRAAAMEMLYGGICIQHLAQPPFPLRTIQSESLPPPSLQGERDDLELEVKDSTGNVMGYRLFPVNIGIRARTESVRVRSEDCYKRFLAQKHCAAAGVPLQFPAPSSITNSNCLATPRAASHFHPPSSSLSLFTRPADSQGGDVGRTTPADVAAYHPRAWRPYQMLKPMPHNWGPAVRSSGVRGPHMQLLQERIDKKGFGWKRKSRSLWQQDISTAGFRPKRYF